jgi:PAS domain S-box-containing protein
MRRLLPFPASPTITGPQRARALRTICVATTAIAAGVLTVAALFQPELWRRTIEAILLIVAITGPALLFSRGGRTRLASWWLLTGLIAIITVLALDAGGITAPGINAYLLFVLIAGILLGELAAVGVALACGALSLGLVVAENLGVLPQQTVMHSSLTRWMILGVLATVVVVLLRLNSRTIGEALARARTELDDRREAERRLVFALDAGAIGVWERDVGDDIVYADERSFAIFGLPATPDHRQQLAVWLRHVHPDDLARIDEGFAELGKGVPSVRVGYRIVRPDGAQRSVEIAMTVVPASGGRPARYAGVLMDVTDRVVAEQEQRRLLADLAERVKELRLLHTAARLLQPDRPYERRVLGDLVAMIPVAWLHPSSCVARIRHGGLEAASPGWQASRWVMTETFTTRRGTGSIEVAYLEEHAEADDGPFLKEERALLASLAEMLEAYISNDEATRDRGELEHQLRQSQKMEALGTLVGGIAHDFNNLLTAIGANAHLAREDTAPDSHARQSIEEIEKAYLRAKALVKRILLFSQRVDAELEPVQLATVVEEATRLLRSSFPSMIRFKSEYGPDLPTVLADASQVHQIVMNLGTNAAHAMLARGGELTIGLERHAVTEAMAGAGLTAGQYLRLTVSDTGTGMSPEILDRLYEPFFTTKGSRGTGLGLAVVHGIVRDHGAQITVESEVGVGTRFSVYFPEIASLPAPREATPVVTIPGAGQHIMYVDDEESLVFVMSRTLERMGYQCTGFTDADAAIHAFRSNPGGFDAVITDFAMPEMTGVELAEILTRIRPDVPVVLATGYGQLDPDDHAAVRLSARLHKPMSVETLSHTLARMLRPAA